MGWGKRQRIRRRVRPIEWGTMGCRVIVGGSEGAGRGADPADPVRVIRERRAWCGRFGSEWVQGLRDVARWGRELGVPIQSGSVELLRSAVARSWGWGSVPRKIAGGLGGTEPEIPGAGAWVLRVPPGCARLVRNRLDDDPRLAPTGRSPWIQLEETALAYLPAEAAGQRRPSRESLLHAARLVPTGRDVGIAAWDLWRAAVAWEEDRASFWLAGHAAVVPDREKERAWRRRARDWGVRVREWDAAGDQPCARIEAGVVRLALRTRSVRRRSVRMRRHRRSPLRRFARAMWSVVARGDRSGAWPRARSLEFT